MVNIECLPQKSIKGIILFLHIKCLVYTSCPHFTVYSTCDICKRIMIEHPVITDANGNSPQVNFQQPFYYFGRIYNGIYVSHCFSFAACLIFLSKASLKIWLSFEFTAFIYWDWHFFTWQEMLHHTTFISRQVYIKLSHGSFYNCFGLWEQKPEQTRTITWRTIRS